MGGDGQVLRNRPEDAERAWGIAKVALWRARAGLPAGW